MRIAIPVWNGRLSPVFDVATRILLVEVIGGEASFTDELPVQRADLAAVVAELGVAVVLCGAISRSQEERLLVSGVEVVAEIRGSVMEVIRGYLEGGLGQLRFAMPGSHSRRRGPHGNHPRIQLPGDVDRSLAPAVADG
jgi:predicted Fe-Mo cluster-binding NifX family protein